MIQTIITGDTPYFIDGISKLPYDYLVCCGNYQKRRIESYIPKEKLFLLGYPRIDSSADKNIAEQIITARTGRCIDHVKKTILWLPTHSAETSLYVFAPTLAKIQGEYNIIIKPHPLLLNVEKFIRSMLPNVFVLNNVSNEMLFPVTDFVICDYGGSAFLSLKADKNVLFFNTYEAELSQDIPELGIRDRIVNFYVTEEEKFFAALKDDSVWEKQKEIRREIRAEFFADNPNPARDIAELCRRIVRGEA
jgi:CDP-glycerol glycerophosphotransferase (TagB/SpsB family)